MLDELKPCPFCESTNVMVNPISYKKGGVTYYRAHCEDCTAYTEGYETKQKAIDVWNDIADGIYKRNKKRTNQH